jgi:hypothetical protein
MAGVGAAFRGRALLVLSGSLLPCGCFDVHQVALDPAGAGGTSTNGPAPGARVIDDFEDGDFRPLDSGFAPWRCITLNPGPGRQPVGCGAAAEGFTSDHGYALWFELSDAPDGVDAYPQAELFAPSQSDAPQDFSGYAQLRLAAKFAPGDHPPSEGAGLTVSLNCNAGYDADRSVDNVARLPGAWERVILPLEDFAQPSWQMPPVDTRSCLARINGIVFDVGDVADGGLANGTLLVDDVYLQ